MKVLAFCQPPEKRGFRSPFTCVYAEYSESDEGSGSTPKAATTRYNYYKVSDVHGKKQRDPGAQSEGVMHPGEPMKQEERNLIDRIRIQQ